MRFGVILSQYVSAPERSSFSQLEERARLAEELGFDLLCLGDRRVYPDGFHELVTTMTALAVLTSRIQICSSGFILPIYHPVLLAEQMAHLDVLSQGRLIFGVVLGYREMGVDTFLFHCQHEGVPNQEILRCMELFASKVVPAFRTAG